MYLLADRRGDSVTCDSDNFAIIAVKLQFLARYTMTAQKLTLGPLSCVGRNRRQAI